MIADDKEFADFKAWHQKQYGWYGCPVEDTKLRATLNDRFAVWKGARASLRNESVGYLSPSEVIDTFGPYKGFPVSWIIDFANDILSRATRAPAAKASPPAKVDAAPELKVSWWCHEWSDTQRTDFLPNGQKRVTYSGWYDVISKDEPKIDGNQSKNKRALIALPDVLAYIDSLCLNGSQSAPFAYAPMPEYSQIISGDNARNSMIVVREAGGAYQVPLYTSPQSKARSLTLTRIREIAETVREENGRGNMVWGQGYRAGDDGRYTIPQLPLAFNKFATALIAELQND